MTNQVFVVEGYHDQMKLEEALGHDIHVVITNGREISNQTLELIKTLSKDNEIILFLDPDFPGERIRNIITNIVPNATQAFLKKSKCISHNHKKVGIEHAKKEDIIEALKNVYKPNENVSTITVNDLYRLHLVGFESSAILRNKLSAKLNIGAPNAKTFLKRVNLFGLTYSDLERMVNEVE